MQERKSLMVTTFKGRVKNDEPIFPIRDETWFYPIDTLETYLELSISEIARALLYASLIL